MRLRFSQTAGAAVLVALAACSDRQPAAPSGPMFATAANAATHTYVVLGSGNALPSDFGAKVRDAGGNLTSALNPIGVAVVTSADPGFAARLSRVQGVQAVAEDLVMDFGQPH